MSRGLIFALSESLAIAFALTTVFSIPARSSDDTRGKLIFLRCASCHDVSSTPSSKIGPNLAHVFERHVASLPDYRYSATLRAKDFIWDSEHLDAWLANPNAVAPGTTMAFAGLSEPADRQAVIDYLRLQNPH